MNAAAKSLGVLLLDEADVFLEERSLSDLKRNSLVAGIAVSNGRCAFFADISKSSYALSSTMMAF